ncbi:hypothetical protein FPSE_00293 [Fusarium pseudograminearum CS3096]|uniref:DUF7730 domain-containing protein n=1 Tax=Fusarium pseudograminearum (strain CS3096) TaxID=1028729 RepID=K3VWN5_FUSPC|nr:hypothetical protein FPSE_00293 [Fusarium pseudograminearum CS3096]EKJ79608.1 hypothetical protein FPSE_00293 [Fusarium pseudograminearum CS3096]
MTFDPGSPCSSGTREQRWKEYWQAQLKKLPVLPNPRPRALTPDPFLGTEANQVPIPRYQESCFWFKVPPNIRRDIIRLAFGDTRLHLFIDWDYLDVPRQPSQKLHCDIARGPLDDENMAKHRIKRLKDETQPEKWQWWGSRCHRVHPNDDGTLGPMTRGGSQGPWADYCRSGGSADICEAWRHQDGPSACHIGVMGWLLSCRQNYFETIDILYSTNTLILEDMCVLNSLPKLLLPQRLALVTSLEITWPLKSCKPPDSTQVWEDLDVPNLDLLLDFVSSSQFTALRRLYMYLPLEDYHELFPGDHPDHMRTILNRLDPLVRRMTHLIECSFALPDDLFKFVLRDAKVVYENGTRTKTGWGSYRQVWRDVNGNMTTVKLPYQDSYPGRPYSIVQDETATGYWILEGSEERVYFSEMEELRGRGAVFQMGPEPNSVGTI